MLRLLAALDRLADDERHGRDRVHRGRARFVADTAEMIADVARHGVVPDGPNAATLTRLLADGLQSPLPQLLREVRARAGRGEPS